MSDHVGSVRLVWPGAAMLGEGREVIVPFVVRDPRDAEPRRFQARLRHADGRLVILGSETSLLAARELAVAAAQHRLLSMAGVPAPARPARNEPSHAGLHFFAPNAPCDQLICPVITWKTEGWNAHLSIRRAGVPMPLAVPVGSQFAGVSGASEARDTAIRVALNWMLPSYQLSAQMQSVLTQKMAMTAIASIGGWAESLTSHPTDNLLAIAQARHIADLNRVVIQDPLIAEVLVSSSGTPSERLIRAGALARKAIPNLQALLGSLAYPEAAVDADQAQ